MDGEPSSGDADNDVLRAISSSELVELVDRALPGLRCPACGSDDFALVDRVEEDLRPVLSLHRWKNPTPWAFSSLVSLGCQNCGHLMQFLEENLRRRAALK